MRLNGRVTTRAPKIVIIGGGPGGYEAALVAAQLGAHVTVVDRDGLGGAAVLTDCVPSKALISTSGFRSGLFAAAGQGFRTGEDIQADLAAINARILALATNQSADIAAGLAAVGVEVLRGTGRLVDTNSVVVTADPERGERVLPADVILIATGATPRELPDGRPDGERILTWQQIYGLTDLPEHLIVVGSGVTGAELAAAYLALGSQVTLVSSRDRVLPGEDPDAADVIENVFTRRGMNVLSRSRAQRARRTGAGGAAEVTVTLSDGREVHGSHVLIAVGAIPQTQGLGLAENGIALAPSGHVQVDRVSRTSARGVYAAGDCTGVLPLASVAAMQGRIAMWHALGDAVSPLNLRAVSANIFTDPEIATVGYSQRDLDAGTVNARAVMLPLATNARAKMEGIGDGFVKLFARPSSGMIVGGVVVAPRASELIHAVALAVDHGLTADQFAHTFTVYPSLSGSLAEAARRLHGGRN